MPGYVDGFVIPIPKKNVAFYQRVAKKACAVWMEYGALDYKECIADDVSAKGHLSFPQLSKAKPSETVVFAWIVFKSRAHRDKVNAQVMKDPRLAKMMAGGAMPFDTKRMTYGGFKTIVETKTKS